MENFIKPFCIQVELLIVNEYDEEVYVPLYLQVETIQGYFIGDEENISLIISGQNYNCKYERTLHKFLQSYFNPMSLN